MTDQEVSEAIAKWIKYSKVGAPDEYDYGNEAPREYGLCSAEKVYRDPSRLHWMTPQERLEEEGGEKYTREDYDSVETVYRDLDYKMRLHVTTYYFGQRPVPVPRQMQESINTFRGKVANEGRQ